MIERKTYLEAVDEMSSPDKFDLTKIDLTIKAVWKMMTQAEALLFSNTGVLRELKWYNILTWINLARLAHTFVTDVIKIWKPNKAL